MIKYFIIVIAYLSFATLIFGQSEINGSVEQGRKPELLSIYDKFKSDESSMLIDLLRKRVDDASSAKGAIILYCGKVCMYGEIEAHLIGIDFALSSKNVDKKKIIVLFGGFKSQTTVEFWVIPTETTYVPIDSINRTEIKFRGQYKKKMVEYECCF